jgi:protein-S-isoprenylcysteine O-methyltransferase Ste14
MELLQYEQVGPRPGSAPPPLSPNDAPKSLTPAALILLLALLAGVILDDVAGLGILGWVSVVPRAVIGIALVLIGARIVLQARAVLRRGGMHVVLSRPLVASATGGIFARTRNPAYQGMCVAVLGFAFLLRSNWTAVLLLLAAPVIHYGLVRREEHDLERKFGIDYVRFKKQVPRYGWLFWPSSGERPLVKDWLAWMVAATVYIVAAYSALWLTDVVIEAMQEPGSGTAAFARASVSRRASVPAAAKKAGLRESSSIRGFVEEIRRRDDGRVNFRGWAAEIGGDGSPLTILAFIDGAKVFEAKTKGELPNVTQVLNLSAAAARNVTFEDTLACRRGKRLIIVATTVGNGYALFDRLLCP